MKDTIVFIFLYLAIGLAAGFVGMSISKAKGQNPAIWFIVCFLFPIAIIGLFALSSQGEQATGSHSQQIGKGTSSESQIRWDTLIEVDHDIKKAALEARSVGQQYESKLAQKYLAVNDKQYLDGILENVLKEAAEEEKIKAEFAKKQKSESLPYRINNDGSYVITKGRGVGKTFSSFGDMVDYLNS